MLSIFGNLFRSSDKPAKGSKRKAIEAGKSGKENAKRRKKNTDAERSTTSSSTTTTASNGSSGSSSNGNPHVTSRILHLNVGGVNIDVLKSTLEQAEKHSLLWNMFQGPLKSHVVDETGRVFLCRDASAFQLVLNYLRGVDVVAGKLRPELEQLYQEAVYLGVDSLAKAIDNAPDNRVLLCNYRGEVKGFVRHGRGTAAYQTPNGIAEYSGDYVNDKREGTGTYQGEDRSKYVGEWKDDMPEGEGTKLYGFASGMPGAEYVGTFYAGKRHGSGKLTRNLGQDVHEGEWVNDVADGPGTQTSCATGIDVVHVGNWRHGKLHGLVEVKHGGVIRTRRYVDGRICGDGDDDEEKEKEAEEANDEDEGHEDEENDEEQEEGEEEEDDDSDDDDDDDDEYEYE